MRVNFSSYRSYFAISAMNCCAIGSSFKEIIFSLFICCWILIDQARLVALNKFNQALASFFWLTFFSHSLIWLSKYSNDFSFLYQYVPYGPKVYLFSFLYNCSYCKHTSFLYKLVFHGLKFCFKIIGRPNSKNDELSSNVILSSSKKVQWK